MYSKDYLITAVDVKDKLLKPNFRLNSAVTAPPNIYGVFPIGIPSYQDVWAFKGYDGQLPGSKTFVGSGATAPDLRFGLKLINELVTQLDAPELLAGIRNFEGRDLILTFKGTINKGSISTGSNPEQAPSNYAKRNRTVLLRKLYSDEGYDDVVLATTGRTMATYVGAPDQSPFAITLPDAAWGTTLTASDGDVCISAHDSYFTGTFSLWVMPTREGFPVPSQTHNMFGAEHFTRLWKKITNITVDQKSDRDNWMTSVAQSLTIMAQKPGLAFPSTIGSGAVSRIDMVSEIWMESIDAQMSPNGNLVLSLYVSDTHDPASRLQEVSLGKIGDGPVSVALIMYLAESQQATITQAFPFRNVCHPDIDQELVDMNSNEEYVLGGRAIVHTSFIVNDATRFAALSGVRIFKMLGVINNNEGLIIISTMKQ